VILYCERLFGERSIGDVKVLLLLTLPLGGESNVLCVCVCVCVCVLWHSAVVLSAGSSGTAQ
jgi:hypothetical protein